MDFVAPIGGDSQAMLAVVTSLVRGASPALCLDQGGSSIALGQVSLQRETNQREMAPVVGSRHENRPSLSEDRLAHHRFHGMTLAFLSQDAWLACLHSTTTAHSATVKLLPSGLLTIDVSVYHTPAVPAAAVLSDSQVVALSEGIVTALKAAPPPPAAASKLFPVLMRGGAFDPYVATTDGLLIQYDFDQQVVHTRSAYQDIKIMHSPQFGNMLLLDNDPNMAESDIIYTRTIMGSGRYSFEGARVLILGKEKRPW